MNKLSIIIFIIFTVFSNNALGVSSMGRVLGDIGDFISEAANGTARFITRRPTEAKVQETLNKIEERLGFSDLGSSPSMKLIEDLAKDRFDPFKDELIKEAYDQEDMETFRTALFKYIRDNHLNSSIVLRWWDLSDDFKNTVFPRLNKDHLSSPWDPTFLLKWWDEAVSRGAEDQLELFLEQGFENMGIRLENYAQFPEGFYIGDIHDPFMRTVFKAMKENKEFSDRVQRIVRKKVQTDLN